MIANPPPSQILEKNIGCNRPSLAGFASSLLPFPQSCAFWWFQKVLYLLYIIWFGWVGSPKWFSEKWESSDLVWVWSRKMNSMCHVQVESNTTWTMAMCPENNKQVNTYEAHNPTVVFLQGIGEICWGFWCWERFVDAAAFDKFLLFFSFLLDWVVLLCAQSFGFETEVVVRMFLCFNVKELQDLLPWRAVRETGGKKQESIKLVRVLKNELPISPHPPTSSLRRLQPCKLCVFIAKGHHLHAI